MYGYEDDDVVSGTSGLTFGLNAASARLTKFEWINNAGKDGAEREALDIQFTIEGGGRPVNYRKFPVTKAFGPNNTEVTDPNSKEIKDAAAELSRVITHILHCFVDTETMRNAFSRPITNFKEYCIIAKSLLPADFDKVPLDIFAQWQYNIKGENTKTYLELPSKMNQGKWVCAAVTPVGSWKKVITPGGSMNYVDDAGNVHPFVRTKWFLESPYATQKIDEAAEALANTSSTTVSNIGPGDMSESQGAKWD